MKKNSLAIVYDWMDSWGGAERLLTTFSEMFPHADWYTLLHNAKKASWSKELEIQKSFLNRLPKFLRESRNLLVPLMPFAIESFDLSSYTHVLSITSAFSKAVITRPETTHISYILTPPRFLWSHQKDYGTSLSLIRPYINYLKNWDYISARRPDKLIAISPEVSSRIKKYYNLESDIISPPFDYSYWQDLAKEASEEPKKENAPFLVVSRFVHYKRVDLVINTFRQMPSRKLIIVGSGVLMNELKNTAPSNVTFKEKISDTELAKLYTTAKALIMPQKEDFGYVALEAQACGCPVIAYNKGGARTTILNEETGLFFESQTPEALNKVLDKYETLEYSIRRSLGNKAKSHLAQFSTEIFKKKFTTLLQ
jgi:glycosyltransferase involved in cell wall biosynthesis